MALVSTASIASRSRSASASVSDLPLRPAIEAGNDFLGLPFNGNAMIHAPVSVSFVPGEPFLPGGHIAKIIAELVQVRKSERENRVIDHDREGSMEIKKREGYF